MAVFKSNVQYAPEELKYVSTLDIPIFDTSSIEKAVKQGIQYTDDDIKQARENFEKTMEYQDELLKVKVDTDEQRKTLDALKDQYGLSPNTFATLDRNALKSPFQSRGIGTSLKRLMSDPKFTDITKQKVEGDSFRDKIPTIKDPRLRDRAKLAYDRYRRGELKSDQLNINDYDSVDIAKEIANAAKLVPELATSDFIKSPDGRLEGTIDRKKRARSAVTKVVTEMMKQPGMRENAIAQGLMTEDGQATDKYYEYVDRLIDEYTKEQTNIDNVKEIDDKKAGATNGRFGTSSEAERVASIIDKDIENGGYELPDASVVLSAAQRRGFLRKNPDGSAELVSIGTDGFEIKNATVKLKKASADYKRTTSAYTGETPNLSGGAFDDVTNIITGIESGGSGGYNAIAKSDTTAALGKHQFMYSDHKDDIKKALDELGIDIEDYSPAENSSSFGPGMSRKDKQIANAFLKNPKAQDILWKNWYEKLYKWSQNLRFAGAEQDDWQLAKDTDAYSDAELMYILHHEGTPKAAEYFIKHGKSMHDSKNPHSTEEINNSLRKIRATLRKNGSTGTINPDGSFEMVNKPQQPTTPQTPPADTAKSSLPATLEDLDVTK